MEKDKESGKNALNNILQSSSKELPRNSCPTAAVSSDVSEGEQAQPTHTRTTSNTLKSVNRTSNMSISKSHKKGFISSSVTEPTEKDTQSIESANNNTTKSKRGHLISSSSANMEGSASGGSVRKNPSLIKYWKKLRNTFDRKSSSFESNSITRVRSIDEEGDSTTEANNENDSNANDSNENEEPSATNAAKPPTAKGRKHANSHNQKNGPKLKSKKFSLSLSKTDQMIESGQFKYLVWYEDLQAPADTGSHHPSQSPSQSPSQREEAVSDSSKPRDEDVSDSETKKGRGDLLDDKALPSYRDYKQRLENEEVTLNNIVIKYASSSTRRMSLYSQIVSIQQTYADDNIVYGKPQNVKRYHSLKRADLLGPGRTSKVETYTMAQINSLKNSILDFYHNKILSYFNDGAKPAAENGDAVKKKKRCTFNNKVQVSYAPIYNRGGPKTWISLTNKQKIAIRKELNSYKSTEMMVHEESRCYTRFH